MAVDFKAATDVLFAKINPEELAEEIGCGLASVKQGRMEGDGTGRRSPPPGWEKGVAKVARRRAQALGRLLVALERANRPGANDA